MLNTSEHAMHVPAARPNGPSAAYGAVIRNTDSPRDIEYRVLARATGLLQDALLPGASPATMPTAVHETRMVWTAFLADLASPGNLWDDVGKARLISLARWALTECDHVLLRRTSPDALIAVNQAVMQGLAPKPHPIQDAA